MIVYLNVMFNNIKLHKNLKKIVMCTLLIWKKCEAMHVKQLTD